MKRNGGLCGSACAVLIAAAVACSSGSSAAGSGACNGVGSATIKGTVHGATFDPKDAVSFSPGNIEVVDFAGLCAFGLGHAKPNATYLNLTFQNGFRLGTTDVGAALDVRTSVWDSKCNSVDQVAGSGSVTLTAIEPCSVTGTFDVVILTNEHLTGSFNAPMCNASGNSACM
jgi:hypothetical protein